MYSKQMFDRIKEQKEQEEKEYGVQEDMGVAWSYPILFGVIVIAMMVLNSKFM